MAQAFFSIDWVADANSENTDDACVLLGEETVSNGKVWCA